MRESPTRLAIDLHAVSVQRGDVWALQDVSLVLRPGERWALLGGNGAGKTQLLKLLAADVWPTPTGREALTYRVGRRTVDRIEAKRRVAYIGAELQDKYARYGWDLAVEDILATGLQGTDLLLRPVSVAQRRRVAAMLERCGLTALRARRFSTLSYGQKRLVLLARGLVQNPDWLLLDEFYNGLDAAHRQAVDAMLAAACAAGQAWVVAAHRAVDVPQGTIGLIELHAGRLRACKRLSRTDLAVMAGRADEPTVQRAQRGVSPRRGGRRTTLRARSGAVLLRIADANLYVDYRLVLRDLTWELRAGEHWAVFGANGAGKSTFLKLLYGDLSPALGGRIERRGAPRGTRIDVWKRRVGYVSPELQTDYAVDVSLLELVASGRHASIGLAATATAADKAQARRWLKFFALTSFAQRRPRELSYGQLRRALFARALVAEPELLLLDEPLTGLDPRQRASMKRLLERLMRRRITLIIAGHHVEDLPRGMTHALELDRRRARASELR